MEKKNFDQPDDVRVFKGKGQAEVIEVGGRHVARATYEPGWSWSANVKPIVGTESCEIMHLAYVVSGQLKVTMNDGEQTTAGPGDVVHLPAGHTGEVVGDVPCVWVDFGDVANYAS